MGIELKWIISFIVLMTIVLVIVIAVMRWTHFSSVQGAISHLNQEVENANTTQAEIAKKIREAKEELSKTRAEAREISEKMHKQAEKDSNAEREEIISRARQEAEDVINKAKEAEEKIRQEIKNEERLKMVDTTMGILKDVLGDKMKGAFASALVDDYLEKLSNVDMSQIGSDINSVEITTATDLEEGQKTKFAEILRSKLNRDISITPKTDSSIGGGAILKFGSTALDGSINSLITEAGNRIKEDIAT